MAPAEGKGVKKTPAKGGKKKTTKKQDGKGKVSKEGVHHSFTFILG